VTITEWHRSSASAGSYVAGWVVSLVLHASLAAWAALFVQRIQLAPQLEPFKWNVALVSPAPSPVQSSPTTSAQVEQRPPSQPTTSATVPPAQPASPAMEQKKSEPLQPQSSVMAAMTPPQQAEPQAAQLVPQTIGPTLQEVVKPIEPVPAAQNATPVALALPVEPISHSPTAVESANPSPQTAYSETSPVPSERDSDSSMAVTPALPQPPTPASPMVTASPPPASLPSITSHITTSPAESPLAVASSSLQVVALVPPGPNRPARTDYGWLSEVVLRRVEELKRYPAEARVDRAEGKVVVKAVINEDGSVDDVEIFQSSGSPTLDNAAVDLMRRAAPFALPHSLGKPRVTIKIPMNYRLDR